MAVGLDHKIYAVAILASGTELQCTIWKGQCQR